MLTHVLSSEVADLVFIDTHNSMDIKFFVLPLNTFNIWIGKLTFDYNFINERIKLNHGPSHRKKLLLIKGRQF